MVSFSFPRPGLVALLASAVLFAQQCQAGYVIDGDW